MVTETLTSDVVGEGALGLYLHIPIWALLSILEDGSTIMNPMSKFLVDLVFNCGHGHFNCSYCSCCHYGINIEGEKLEIVVLDCGCPGVAMHIAGVAN